MLAPRGRREVRPSRAAWAVRVVVVAVFALAGAALADGPPPSDGMPVIAAGREQDIVALLKPWGIGQEVVPGWALENVSIEATRLRCVFAGPGGQSRALILTYPGRAPNAPERTRSFALLREAPPGPPPVPDPLDAMAAAVKQNDTTDFWPPVPGRGASARGATAAIATSARTGGASRSTCPATASSSCSAASSSSWRI